MRGEINQTNRTLLFEVINPEKSDLITSLSDDDLSKKRDDIIKQIDKELLVSSIEDFFNKFDPTLYCETQYSENEAGVKTPRFVYHLEKPKNMNGISVIKLNQNHEVIKTLFSLIDSKNKKDHLFDFKSVLEMLSPAKLAKDVKNIRKELVYKYNKFLAAPEGSLDKNDLGNQVDDLRDKIEETYKNLPSLLTLASEDCKTKLFPGGVNTSNSNGNEKRGTRGILSLSSDGSLEVKEITVSTSGVAVNDDSSNVKLRALLEGDYDENQKLLPTTNSEESIDNQNAQDDFTRSLVLNAFAPLAATNTDSTVDKELEIRKNNSYIPVLKEEKEELLNKAIPLLQTIIGVKLFFDQHQTKDKMMQPKLLISNCSAADCADEKKKLATFLEHSNIIRNHGNEVIWFAIVPNVDLGISSKKRKNRLGALGGNNQTRGNQAITDSKFVELMKILKDYKIQTFFSSTANEKSNMNVFNMESFEQLVEKSESIKNNSEIAEYSILAAPNFTIIPDDKSYFSIGSTFKLEKDQVVEDEKLKVRLGGVYASASYVAAGLTAAVQSPAMLKNYFKKVDQNIPGVKIDLEARKDKIFTTVQSGISGYTSNLEDKIMQSGFGFIFSPNNTRQNNGKCSVLTSRSFSKFDDIFFELVYRTTSSTYLMRLLDYELGLNPAKSKVEKWSRNDKKTLVGDKVNSLIKDEKELNLIPDEDNGMLDIMFKLGRQEKPLKKKISKQ